MPEGGGWRAHGRGKAKRSRAGYAFIHSAVDDHSRLAYSEVLSNERAETATAFLLRACAWFASLGVAIRTVYTDNGAAYRSRLFQATCRSVGIRSKRTRPYRPQTNGKVERFHRTMLNEWPTSASTSLKPSAQLLSDLGCICIITTVVTPQSEVSRPSPVSTTSPDTTSSAQSSRSGLVLRYRLDIGCRDGCGRGCLPGYGGFLLKGHGVDDSGSARRYPPSGRGTSPVSG